MLEAIVARRLARRLSTVIDTLGLDGARRRAWLEAAKRAGLPCVAVTFDAPAEQCRARNRARARPVPAAVLTAQLRTWRGPGNSLRVKGSTPSSPTRRSAWSPRRSCRPRSRLGGRSIARPGCALVSTWDRSGSRRAGAHPPALRQVAASAETAGFDALYVMDHFRQIPQIGRTWEDFLESYTTLSYLAACTERARLGVLVTGVTYRNPAHLGKIVATLDVLSGGRAACGLGLAWYHEEHAAYGWEFPSARERYALLEDTLRLLPLMWGSGSPRYEGSRVIVPEALCYPRPLQAHVPVIVGGGGERRTLRLAARYADAANVTGDTAVVRRKADVLRSHCERERGDPRAVELTHLSTVLIGADDRHVAELVERSRPRRRDPAQVARDLNAGTVVDHVGRFRELADAGVGEVMVRLPDPLDPTSMELMAEVMAAFR